MRKLISTLAFALLFLSSSYGQQVTPVSSTAIYQKIQQLGTLGTVMYFAAHPDDDNTRLLAYLVYHDHVRTIYYSLTRGDGGQNILGDEQGPVLGLIRTYELLQSRKIDGAEQLFSPFVDFGYTVSVNETFHFWNKEKLIQDAVKAIQETHPDLIICRFPTDGEGIHGQHTASAIVAKDAWLYIKNYNDTATKKLWLPKRELFNAFQFGSHSTIEPGQFKVKINQYDPLLGEGLGVLAGKSRSENKSQGAGTPQVVGTTVEHFQLVEGSPVQHSLYDGVDTSWSRIGHPEIGEAIQKVIQNFKFDDPSASIPALISIKKSISNLPGGYWREQKSKAVNRIILACAGVFSEALTNEPIATPGESIPVNIHVIARSTMPVSIQTIAAARKILNGTVHPTVLKNDSLYDFPFQIKLSDKEPVTQPYWMETPAKNDRYQFPAKYLGMPVAPNNLTVYIGLKIRGEDFSILVPISYKKLDPVRGDVTQRLRIVPAVSIRPGNKLLVYTKGQYQTITLQLKVYKTLYDPKLIARGHSVLQTITLPTLKAGTDTFITMTLPGKALASDSLANYVSFSIHYYGKDFDKAVHLINYPHIPELQYLTVAKMKKVPKDWQVAVHRIGYVEGVGDYVDNVLRLCGLKVEQIPMTELNDENYLNRYDAIVVGIRAFNKQKELKAGITGLLNYVHNGGTLIVQYNKSFHLETTQLGPYPITLSSERVTNEDAPVTFTNPQSSLMNFPNKITQNDFKGWVQERGLYAPVKWDAHYQTLFSIPGVNGIYDKPIITGSVLYTPYGRGQYIYTSMAFFRQLPAGNVGAIRLFMNFLSAGKRQR